MSGPPQRGVFQLIFKHFIASLKPRRFTGDHIGTDYLGNKYFQLPPNSTSTKKTPARYFEPEDKDNFEKELPAEWEAWLRHRRKEPPSEEEVMRNLAVMKMKKKNAAELELKAKAVKKQIENVAPLPKSTTFPEYPEYKIPESVKESKGRKD